MDWLISLFNNEGIAHTILIYAMVISLGVLIGKVKFFGISLGVTFVLFVGILVGHLGFSINHEIMHFIREFGLILFIYSIGLQVGPGFFSSFKKGGMQQNFLAASVVLLGAATTIAIYFILQGRIEMPMLVGVMSGAITNTPGLGAAQEALRQLFEAGKITEIPQIALGYAVAYPLGVTGIILALVLVKLMFKINLKNETDTLYKATDHKTEIATRITVVAQTKAVCGKSVAHVKRLLDRQFVVSRLMSNGEFVVPNGATKINKGDTLMIITTETDAQDIIDVVGEKADYDWKESDEKMISKRIVITRDIINGKTIGSLKLRNLNVNVTRIVRAGMDLIANDNIVLQVGDRVIVVGSPDAVLRVEKTLGNSLKSLDEPHLITLFVGIFLGIILGSMPMFIPGMPMPVKLGLAGGPLVVAILIGRFGFKMRLITYTTQSANLMLREIGITLFLASVGIASGDKFIDTVVSADGLLWIASGFVITILPLLIVGFVGRKFLKINYFTLMGLLAGSCTDPPALAYANATAGNDAPAVAYSTVYPLTMFLRVIMAQILILAFL